MDTGRFAPSTTGPAHPGTLMAALLAWLDARSGGGRVLLRLEDLDPERSSPERVVAMERDLAWLGLEWDGRSLQSEAGERYAEALDRLAELGRLYPCACSRARIAGAAGRTPDGGARYPGTCRERGLPAGGWRASQEPLRVRLPAGWIALRDESGADLGQDPGAAFGDPVVRRRDGAAAYQLASIVDDAASDVTRVVRGRDLASTTATQTALRRLLELPEPVHRHHFLLLERRGAKLAKLHGAVGTPDLRRTYDAPALCGFLAHAAGLQPDATPTTPADLVPHFSWTRVTPDDTLVHWTGEHLALP